MSFGPIPPAQLDQAIWTARVGPGGTLYTVQYKAGEDDIRFNFENDNSYIDLPIYLLWGTNAQNLDQAKRDILGYPLVLAGTVAGLYVSRVTPMAALPFLQLTSGRPYLFAVTMQGTGWGVPDNQVIKNSTLNFPIYKQTKCTVHFETLTYDVFTDLQMEQLGLVDANGNPDEATLARYVTKEVQPGMEYLTLPQGGFQFVNTGMKPVPGTAGKLVPNYDIALTWEMIPQSCIGTVLYNPGLTNPPIDNCLGHVNKVGFPPFPITTNVTISSVSVNNQGVEYAVGDSLFAIGGLPLFAATFLVTSVGAGGNVTGVSIVSGGNYVNNGAIPSPPSNPVSTATNGEGSGCTLNLGSSSTSVQQLMTAYPAHQGSGYALGDLLSLSGGIPNVIATVRVIALATAAATGPVLAVEIVQRGSYQVSPGTPSPPANPVITSGGTGSGCTLLCEFGNGIPPGQLLMTAATITPIRSTAGDRLYRLAYRFKYLPQGIQRLYYQGTAAYVAGPTFSISSITNTVNPTVTTTSSNDFSIGQTVTFSGTGTALDNLSFQVVSITSPTVFAVTASAPGSSSGGSVGLAGNFQDAGYFEVTTNGFTNTGLNLYNNDSKTPPVNIYPWADFATLFRVPS